MTIVAFAGAVFCILGGYWAYLDNSQYLDVSEENVSLYHGHPEFSGFGLPQKIWEFDFGSELIDDVNSSQMFSRRSNINEILDSVLSINGKVELQLLQGKIESARANLRQAIDQTETPSPTLLQLMENVVRKGDEEWLTNRALEANPEHAGSFIHALAALDGERAVQALRASAIEDNFGHQLNLLSKWSAPCGPATQLWFQDFLNNDSSWLPVSTVALAMIRSKCKFPIETAILVNDNFLEAAITAVKLTSPTEAEKLGVEVAKELIAEARQLTEFNAWDADIPRKHEQLTTRLFFLSQLLDEPVCVPEFLDQIPHEPLVKTNITTRLHLLALLHRGCQGSTLRIEIGVVAIVVFLSNMQGEETEVLYLPTSPEITASILPAMDLLIEGETPNVVDALLDVLHRSSNPELRLALIRRLRYLSAQGEDALDYILPEQYLLERELIRWLADTSPARASEYLVHRLRDIQNTTLLETLALIDLISNDRDALLQSAIGFERNARIATQALVGDTKTVADLLSSPNVAMRNIAVIYAPIRADWPVLKETLTRSPYVALALYTGQRLEADIASLKNELNAAPPWALPWLAGILDHSGVAHPAAALRLEQLRERMKIRWTSSKG